VDLRQLAGQQPDARAQTDLSVASLSRYLFFATHSLPLRVVLLRVHTHKTCSLQKHGECSLTMLSDMPSGGIEAR